MSIVLSDVNQFDSSPGDRDIVFPTPTADQAMLKLLDDGNSAAQIASQLGVSISLVHSTLQPLASTVTPDSISQIQGTGKLSVVV